jgi:DNA replication and repair protein RecF
MSLTHLQVKNLRNLTEISVTPNSRFNVIYGENGSGKTSFLEAIYFLGLGRSFRTHLSNRIIRENEEKMSIVGQVSQIGAIFPVGVERSRQGEIQMKMRGKSCDSILEMADILPLQLINSDAHRLLTDGPKFRRRFLDWGVFHVEHSFYPLWQRVSKATKQRNAALRFAPSEQIKLWDRELVAAGEAIHHLRDSYIQQFIPLFSTIIESWLKFPITLNYYSGWPNNRQLEESISSSLSQDRQLGYTQFGPHRADVTITIGKLPAHDRLSQGQQKLAVYALRLAQGMLLQQQTGKQCIFLIDDLPAELDEANREYVIAFLENLRSQVFVTGIESADLNSLIKLDNAKLFHVEQGMIK